VVGQIHRLQYSLNARYARLVPGADQVQRTLKGGDLLDLRKGKEAGREGGIGQFHRLEDRFQARDARLVPRADQVERALEGGDLFDLKIGGREGGREGGVGER